jgi:ATPases of the AAA+ class
MLFFSHVLYWKDYAAGKDYSVNDDFMDPFSGRRGNSENDFERRYRESYLSEKDDDYLNDYLREKKFLVHVTRRTSADMEVFTAVDINYISERPDIKFLQSEFPDCVIKNSREITVEEFRMEMTGSKFSGHRVLSKLNLDYRISLFDDLPFKMESQMGSNEKKNKKQCLKRAGEILASESVFDEINRIFSNKNKRKYYGHPVQYYITTGDWGAAMDIAELIIDGLYSTNRLLSTRQLIIRNVGKGTYRDERYKQIIEAAEGGVVIVELSNINDMGIFASDYHEFTRHTGAILEKRKKDTLFIFVEIMGKSIRNEDAVNNIITKADFIKLTEGSGTKDEAAAYLKELTSRVDFAVDDASDAAEFLPDAESYSVTDIFNAYNAWYGSGLKNHVYKAYKDKTTFKVERFEVDSKPYEELQSMIGLTEAKSLVDHIISAAKVMKVRQSMGLNCEGSSLNMIFTGNPGTAKTTVARLIAKILKEEDAVKSGRFIECGRQDLVGKYVGWTAKIVEDKFRQASGGVLFIDEAYSLVDDSKTYGAEAINTITQLMENYRDEVIVIFAGYPDKMRDFLAQNEGLKSRIAFHLDFPDYNPDELTAILKHMSDKREYVIEDNAVDYCKEILSFASREENFGNGRYVRNLLEQAILRQSDRLIAEHTDGEAISKAEMCALRKDDFKPVHQSLKKDSVRIGFAR